MAAGDPLSRAAIRLMAADEFTERQLEVKRWLAAGAVDGQAAPPAERPEGHVFTRAEVAAMSVDDYERHEERIKAQMRGEGFR